VGPAYDKVGWHASDTHPLSFSGARVPAENLLGERGRGFANFLSILDEGRIAIAALATGAAEGCLEAALDYAGSRIVFAEPLGSRQSIQFLLARMQQRVHVAPGVAARRAPARRRAAFATAAALAKLTAGEAAMDNARDATQIFGGNGFMNEYPVARHYRDAKILEIGEGTTEVQLLVIARALGLTSLGSGARPAR
jgi:alkylation response protein AidB-like acyl-CoA dehydrogenase